MKFNFAPIFNYKVTSKFGRRNTGISGASTDHKGIDLVYSTWRSPCNLILPHEGKLIKAYWNNIRGWTCEFDIGEGYTILFQHMKYSCPLKVGTEYSAGTVVGIMGNSSTLKIAPHLHFEVRFNGVEIDPLPFISNLEEEVKIEQIEVKDLDTGKLVKVDAINYKDHYYVKLRDMEDKLNKVDVEWDGTHATVED